MKTKLFKKVINSSLGRLLVIVVILLIPFLYSFCFLKAFWDPYAKMKDIPVAMVNLDKGDRGKEILKRIQGKNVMKMITFTDEKEAVSNLYDRNVYAVIIIPEDFTGNLNQVASSRRKEPIIKFLTNKKNNFVTSQIYDRVIMEVQKNIENEVSS